MIKIHLYWIGILHSWLLLDAIVSVPFQILDQENHKFYIADTNKTTNYELLEQSNSNKNAKKVEQKIIHPEKQLPFINKAYLKNFLGKIKYPELESNGLNKDQIVQGDYFLNGNLNPLNFLDRDSKLELNETFSYNPLLKDKVYPKSDSITQEHYNINIDPSAQKSTGSELSDLQFGSTRTDLNTKGFEFDDEITSQYPLRNIYQWLEKHGIPEEIPPIAWCSHKGITIAIPENYDSYMHFKKAYDLPEARWAEQDEGCKISLVRDFLDTKNYGRIGAWVGSAPFKKCAGHYTQTESHSYYINTIYHPIAKRSVIGICSCAKNIQKGQEYISNHLNCIPSAQWKLNWSFQDTFSGHPIDDFIDTNSTNSIHRNDYIQKEALGFVISNFATVGKYNNIIIKNADPKIVFESAIESKTDYLWPIECNVKSEEKEGKVSEMPLIIGGCPISSKLNFTRHEEVSEVDNTAKVRPGRIIFSISAVSFVDHNKNSTVERETVLNFKCKMGVFDKMVSEEDFCNQLSFKILPMDAAQLNNSKENFSSENNLDLEISDSSQTIAENENKIMQNILLRKYPFDSSDIFNYEDRILNRQLQYKSAAIESMKPKFIREVSGPQQISSWKKYNGADYLEDYWAWRTEKAEREARMIKAEKKAEENQQYQIQQQSENMLRDREYYLSQLISKHPDFSPSNLNGQDLWYNQMRDQNLEKYNNRDQEFLHNNSTVPMRGYFFHRTILSESEVFDRIDSSIIYGPWAVNWRNQASTGSKRVSVGNSRGAVGIGTSVPRETVDGSFIWGPNKISFESDQSRESARVGVLRGKYGIAVERSNRLQATNVETISRFVETTTLVDEVNSIYGERVRVRNLDFDYRRDFGTTLDSQESYPEEPLIQEMALNYRSVSIVAGSNRLDKQYLASVGMRGHQYTAVRDFDDNIMDFQANWGNGWQAVLKTDFIDVYSNEILTGIEFGKLGRAYAGASVGVGIDGMPQGSAIAQTADLGLAVEFVDNSGVRLMNYALTVGKFTYTWESTVQLDNLFVPILLSPL